MFCKSCVDIDLVSVIECSLILASKISHSRVLVLVGLNLALHVHTV
jgi:hypothetical protein